MTCKYYFNVSSTNKQTLIICWTHVKYNHAINILELQINILSTQLKGLVMEKKYKTKEELIAAFKHAVGAKDAFESLNV